MHACCTVVGSGHKLRGAAINPQNPHLGALWAHRAAAFGAALLAPLLATYCAALPLAVEALRRAPGGTLPAKKLLRCIQVRSPGSCMPVTDAQHPAACWVRVTARLLLPLHQNAGELSSSDSMG